MLFFKVIINVEEVEISFQPTKDSEAEPLDDGSHPDGIYILSEQEKDSTVVLPSVQSIAVLIIRPKTPKDPNDTEYNIKVAIQACTHYKGRFIYLHTHI